MFRAKDAPLIIYDEIWLDDPSFLHHILALSRDVPTFIGIHWIIILLVRSRITKPQKGSFKIVLARFAILQEMQNLSKKYGPYTQRELAGRLAKVSDAEILAYHRKRVWRSRYYYLAGLACGIGVIPFIIFNNLAATIIVGIIGIVFVQYGRLQRERWQKTFQNLMEIRGKPLRKPDGKALPSKKKGAQ